MGRKTISSTRGNRSDNVQYPRVLAHLFEVYSGILAQECPAPQGFKTASGGRKDGNGRFNLAEGGVRAGFRRGRPTIVDGVER